MLLIDSSRQIENKDLHILYNVCTAKELEPQLRELSRSRTA